uniref:Uncharacterized protein n=1 Tax=Ixodes ricinus TaxID=34613 RepID=A0A6B0UZA6_IXORI
MGSLAASSRSLLTWACFSLTTRSFSALSRSASLDLRAIQRLMRSWCSRSREEKLRSRLEYASCRASCSSCSSWLASFMSCKSFLTAARLCFREAASSSHSWILASLRCSWRSRSSKLFLRSMSCWECWDLRLSSSVISSCSWNSFVSRAARGLPRLKACRRSRSARLPSSPS